jgi:hypothetical protein
MTTLAELQQALQSHVLHGDDAIVRAIDESSQIPASVRLGVYSDAYRLRLIEALESNFPVLAKLMGEAPFARLTQEYLLQHPSRHFSIRWFGDRLAEFLTKYPDYREQPWFAELAQWEWKIASAFDADDITPISMEDIARHPPETWSDLRFSPHPSVQSISLSTNVAAIFKAAATEADLPAPVRLVTRTDWLIWRQDLTVQYRPLDEIEAIAIGALLGEITFGEMCERLVEKMDADEVPLRAAGLLKQWIADCCVAGAKTA